MTAATDQSFAIASEEFLWSESQAPPAHRYLLPPVLRTLRNYERQRILDLGCGNGAASACISRQGFLVSGCDSSESGLALARANYAQINFFAHDLASPLPVCEHGSYDAVVSLEVVEHLMRPRQLLLRAREALRPGGLLLVSTPYHGYWKNLALALANAFDAHWHPLRDFGHVKFFSRSTLHALLRDSGFFIDESLRLGRIPVLARSLLVTALKLGTE
jgi:2-polyprenyl-6-hydroxyphenyl methylase/3-demethylubiquinone-9 3-methyltransferase